MGNVSVYLGEPLIEELDKVATENHYKNRSSLVKSAVEDKVHYLRAKPIRCMECEQPIKDAGMGLVSWFVDSQKRFFAFSVHHKGKCDRQREQRFEKVGLYQSSQELIDVSNPKGFMSFVFAVLGYWNEGYSVKDFEGLSQAMDRISKSVLRRSTRKEQEAWDQVFHLAIPFKGTAGRPRASGGSPGDPFGKVIGIGGDGSLSQSIDEALYGEESR